MRATSSSRWSASGLALAFVIAFSPGVALAQAPADPTLPAVTASPVDRDGPNGGQWFAVEAGPGETVRVEALIANPAEAEQTVHLYLADLTFVTGRDPEVGAKDAGIGTWGAFAEPVLSLGPKEATQTEFTVTVPADAEPGDHIGVVVAESGASGPQGGVGVVKRVAARLYVTVPGDAAAAVAIEDVDTSLDRTLLPRHVRVTFIVRNTGTIRLDAEVRVNGRVAGGPETIVSQSGEPYEIEVPIGIWGGRKEIDIQVETRTASGTGPTASVTRHVLVLPWWVLLALFLLAVGIQTVRELAKRLR